MTLHVAFNALWFYGLFIANNLEIIYNLIIAWILIQITTYYYLIKECYIIHICSNFYFTCFHLTIFLYKISLGDSFKRLINISLNSTHFRSFTVYNSSIGHSLKVRCPVTRKTVFQEKFLVSNKYHHKMGGYEKIQDLFARPSVKFVITGARADSLEEARVVLQDPVTVQRKQF